MREEGPAALVGPVQVRCPYCQAIEVLPAEQAQRVTALRARLAHLRMAQAAEEGPALAFAQTTQTLRKQLPMYLAFGAFILISTTSGAVGQIQKAIALRDIPLETREEILSSATFSVVSLGRPRRCRGRVPAGAAEIQEGDRAHLARARAPLQAGLPARCRSCGASLPVGPATTAMVACPYCAASNLLTPELASDRARLLEEETRAYNERAHGVTSRATKAAVSFQTYFFLGAGIGVALAAVLAVSLRIVNHESVFLASEVDPSHEWNPAADHPAPHPRPRPRPSTCCGGTSR